MIKKLAWVTTRDAHGRDEDEPAVLAALRIKGVSVEVTDWDDISVNWSQFDRVVLRSAWDYPKRLTEFLFWLDHVASTTEVVNAPKTVRWNLDKQYLIELANAGIPITPTNFVKPGSETIFPSGEFVIKPAIGAGSRDAASYAKDQQEIARAHVARLHAAGQTVLVQPLLKSIDTDGEWPLVFLAASSAMPQTSESLCPVPARSKTCSRTRRTLRISPRLIKSKSLRRLSTWSPNNSARQHTDEWI